MSGGGNADEEAIVVVHRASRRTGIQRRVRLDERDFCPIRPRHAEHPIHRGDDALGDGRIEHERVADHVGRLPTHDSCAVLEHPRLLDVRQVHRPNLKKCEVGLLLVGDDDCRVLGGADQPMPDVRTLGERQVASLLALLLANLAVRVGLLVLAYVVEAVDAVVIREDEPVLQRDERPRTLVRHDEVGLVDRQIEVSHVPRFRGEDKPHRESESHENLAHCLLLWLGHDCPR